MGNSLQDQLLKAGLIDEQRLRREKTAKRKKIRQTHGKGLDGQQQQAREAAREKAERDRELDRQRRQAAAQKAEQHALRQLIHAHRVLRGEGEVAFNFQDGGALKRVYVSVDQQRALAQGTLALVRQDNGYELVPRDVAEKVAARNANLILVLNGPGQCEEATGDQDDPYAAYKVPDDLMW